MYNLSLTESEYDPIALGYFPCLLADRYIICPLSARRKAQNMSPFCRQKGTEFFHSLLAEGDPDSCSQALPVGNFNEIFYKDNFIQFFLFIF